MNVIQIFQIPQTLRIRYSQETTFSRLFERKDQDLINSIWDNSENRLSESREYATLWNTTKGVLTYHKTSYKEYFGITRADSLGFKIRPVLTSQMRISSVGSAVVTKDKKVCIQRRQKGLLAGGYFDSGAAGLCKVSEGKLDFEMAIREKLQRELGINNENIESLVQTGVHTSTDYCSGMVTYAINTNLTFNNLKNQANKEYVNELIGIDLDKLPEFVVYHYNKRKEMVGDGCATLLEAIENPLRKKVIDEINKKTPKIFFGTLTEGKFIKS